jgi:hypothetical protein
MQQAETLAANALKQHRKTENGRGASGQTFSWNIIWG